MSSSSKDALSLETLRPLIRRDAVTWLSFYLVLLFAVPSRLVVGPVGSAGAPSQLFALAGLIWWFWYQVAVAQHEPSALRPVRAAMMLFLLAIGASYIHAMVGPIAADEVSTADAAVLSAGAWAGTFLVAHDGIPTRDRLDVLVRTLGAVAGLLALLGLAQFVLGRTIVDGLTIPGLTTNQAAFQFDRLGFTRPSGTATHPIEFGVVLTMLLPLTLHMAFHGSARFPLLRSAPAGLVALLILLSMSRSAIVGTVVALLVLLVGWPAGRRNVVLLLTCALSGAVFVAVPGVLGSVLSMFTGIENDPSALSRVDSYGIAGSFIADRPWLGRGLGTFLPKYWILDNQYLLLLITVGVAGTTAFIAIVVAALVVLRRVRRTAVDEPTRDLALCLAAAVCAGAAGLAFFDGFSFPMTPGTLFLLLGMAGALHRLTRSRTQR